VIAKPVSTTTASSLPHASINFYSSSAFLDRADAGKSLTQALRALGPFQDPLLLALPRGGVPVACQVAAELGIPLDIFLVRKFSLPERPEVSVGIVASGGVQILNLAFQKGNSQHQNFPTDLASLIDREHAALARRESAYRQSRPAEPIAGRSVIVIDDGLTTGATMRNAIQALRHLSPAQIIAAVPVASPEVCAELQSEADSVVCPCTPSSFFSVRRCYRDFSPVLDLDIRSLLDSVSSQAHLTHRSGAFHA